MASKHRWVSGQHLVGGFCVFIFNDALIQSPCFSFQLVCGFMGLCLCKYYHFLVVLRTFLAYMCILAVDTKNEGRNRLPLYLLTVIVLVGYFLKSIHSIGPINIKFARPLIAQHPV